jgi:hypothetical protein
MKKSFPFKKVENKLESLYLKRDELERDGSSDALCHLDDRILALEYQLEERPFKLPFGVDIVQRQQARDRLQHTWRT